MSRPPTDEAAMASVYAAHAPAVRAYLGRRAESPQVAEDLVQETFLRVWRTVDRLDTARDAREVRSYVLTVARNVATDAWRAARRRPELLDDGSLLGTVPEDDGLDEAVDGWLVAEALARLSPDHREVVRALFHDGLSVRQAATRLGVPEGTVKSRSHYAVRALRAVFDEMGVTR